MNEAFLLNLLSAAIAAGTPLLLAAAGEMMAERAGVMNLGVEGMMLTGAACGFLAALGTGSQWWGLLAAVLAGGILSLIHGFISITLRGNQVVSGLTLTILGAGLSSFITRNHTGIALTSKFSTVPLPGLSEIPLLGQLLFNQNPLVYISLIVTAVLYIYLYHTTWGLSHRAVGEDPAAADASGINVALIRYISTFCGGMLAGAAGAYLSLAYAPSWLDNMTAGRGWIALALVIFAMWDPLRILLGAYLFGGVEALTFRLQTIGVTVSPFFLQMAPYITTIIVLLFVVIRKREGSGMPAALGLPYDRENS